MQLQIESKITLRRMVDSDIDFLRRLYATTRSDIAQSPLSVEEKTKLLDHQFQAQHIHYQHFFSDASFDIVLIDETRIGQLYVQNGPTEFLVIVVAIMPEFQKRGIGTKLVREIMDRAIVKNMPVRLRVEPANHAKDWYLSLGFKKIADEQTNWHLEWNPVECGQCR